MSLSKLSDSDGEMLIELWRNERSLWDVTSPHYSNARLARFLFGSRPSDYYFRSVCLSVSLSVCLCRVFLSRLWSDFNQTRKRYICLGL